MRALLSLALASSLFGQVPKSYAVNTGWAPKPDKQLHMIAGAFIGFAAYQASAKVGNNDPMWDVLFWVTLAALWKENYDRHHGGRPDYADVAYTELGGIGIGLAIRWSEKKKEFATALGNKPTP